MAEEVQVYDGFEREQVFVRRYERNPNAGKQTKRGGYDQRPYRTTAQWGYCLKRHRDHWRGRGAERRVPDYRFEGEEGWWFPACWIVEFAQTMLLQQQGAAT